MVPTNSVKFDSGPLTPLPARRHDADGIFAHHGAYGPGVRLFRKLRIGHQALIVGISFMLPISVLLAHTLTHQGGPEKDTVATMTAVALSLMLAAYLFRCFFLVIDGGVKQVHHHIQHMTAGDLTSDFTHWGQDDIAAQMKTLRELQDNMRLIVFQMLNGTDNIVHSSSEIAAGTMDLSNRTEQTASHLEKSASSMEELSATVKYTAEHATQAADIARHNASVATQGGQIMGSMVTTMNDIHQASSKISEIISVIDGLAFQTNILALNAAVEAARAGEAGRGFAVVASEVRSLAQRSTGAAREIKALITNSVDKVEAGGRIVTQAGLTISEIVEGAQRIDQLLKEIATGAHEQSLGVSQIGEAVTELDHSTQANAALVEQTAAAAHAMKDQAKGLAGEAKRYRLPPSYQGGKDMDQAQTLSAEFNFDAAIEAHRQWKVKLRSAIDKKEKLDAESLSRDDCCALGKWVHGPGCQRWSSKPGFVDLVEKHTKFHHAAGEVAKRINAGAYSEAERLIGAGSAFAQVSTEVVMALTRAKNGL